MLTFTERLFIRLNYNPEIDALADFNDYATELTAAAGLMVNLMLDFRVRLDHNHIHIIDPRPTQDPMLDEALARLAAIPTFDHKNPEWFLQVADKLSFGAQLLQQFTQKGLIYRQEKKGLFGLSKSESYHFYDRSLPAKLFEPERTVMLLGAGPDPETAVLTFMAGSWGAPRPWKLSNKEHQQYDKRYETLFGGWYSVGGLVEPIDGLPSDLRSALTELIISWATSFNT
jgi:hypothetical protein